jgi:coenzyme F420-reducing hydrogenase delta subunit
MSDFEPKIIAYCCNFCAFAAADLAGAMRLQYSPNVRIVRLPCTGKVDAVVVMKAIEDGADGVFVAGCLEGQCHYLKGNLRAKKRVAYIKRLLEEVGIEPARVEMYNLSSAMGARFAEIVEEVTERIKELGPVYASGQKEQVKGKCLSVLSVQKVRIRVSGANVYGQHADRADEVCSAGDDR